MKMARNILSIITPTEIELKITSATSQKLILGSEFWLEGKLMISRRRWHSVIKSIRPYQYLDEMLTGPLRKWRHLHQFNDCNTLLTRWVCVSTV
jgi:ligand-binding SRPBCC domain-containing protein